MLSSDDFGSSVGRRSGGHPVYGTQWERLGGMDGCRYSVLAGWVVRAMTTIGRLRDFFSDGAASLDDGVAGSIPVGSTRAMTSGNASQPRVQAGWPGRVLVSFAVGRLGRQGAG